MVENSNSTNGTGTAVQHYTPDNDGWTDPIDPESGRQIQGELLTFNDKQFFAGSGKYKDELAIGTQLVAVGVKAGFKLWQDGACLKFVTEIDGRFPRRAELGHNDESLWKPGPDGKPDDPFQNSRELRLFNPATGEEYTFCTHTKGGCRAVDKLKSSFLNALGEHPGQRPVVSLQWKPMPTDYGMKSKPYFHIVGWYPPNVQKANVQKAAIARNSDMDDDIPF
jgi:hypothetical protein